MKFFFHHLFFLILFSQLAHHDKTKVCAMGRRDRMWESLEGKRKEECERSYLVVTEMLCVYFVDISLVISMPGKCLK